MPITLPRQPTKFITKSRSTHAFINPAGNAFGDKALFQSMIDEMAGQINEIREMVGASPYTAPTIYDEDGDGHNYYPYQISRILLSLQGGLGSAATAWGYFENRLWRISNADGTVPFSGDLTVHNETWDGYGESVPYYIPNRQPQNFLKWWNELCRIANILIHARRDPIYVQAVIKIEGDLTPASSYNCYSLTGADLAWASGDQYVGDDERLSLIPTYGYDSTPSTDWLKSTSDPMNESGATEVAEPYIPEPVNNSPSRYMTCGFGIFKYSGYGPAFHWRKKYTVGPTATRTTTCSDVWSSKRSDTITRDWVSEAEGYNLRVRTQTVERQTTPYFDYVADGPQFSAAATMGAITLSQTAAESGSYSHTERDPYDDDILVYWNTNTLYDTETDLPSGAITVTHALEISNFGTQTIEEWTQPGLLLPAYYSRSREWFYEILYAGLSFGYFVL